VRWDDDDDDDDDAAAAAACKLNCGPGRGEGLQQHHACCVAQ